MQCPHFDVGECRSCPLMGVPYARQLADKQAAVLAALADAVDADTVVAASFASAEAGFRNKAKLVVTGSAAAPRLGILDPRQHPRHHDGAGVDLRDCGLYEAGMEGVFEACAAAVTADRSATTGVVRTSDSRHPRNLAAIAAAAAIMAVETAVAASRAEVSRVVVKAAASRAISTTTFRSS